MYNFPQIEDFDSALLDGILTASAILSLVMATALLMKAFSTSYRNYARSCLLSAIAYMVFAVGYLLHVKYHFRIHMPTCYVAVCISYLHIGGALLGLSHISILDPDYFKPWRVVRDVVCVLFSLLCLWLPFILQQGFGVEVADDFNRAAHTWWHALLLVPFFLHCGYLALDIYLIYARVRKLSTLQSLPHIDHFVKWLFANCHFIVFVGISSAVVVLYWGEIPNAMTILMVVAMLGFCMMFKNIISYSYDIDAAYPTIEHVSNTEKNGLAHNKHPRTSSPRRVASPQKIEEKK